jgi:hypothetical protein
VPERNIKLFYIFPCGVNKTEYSVATKIEGKTSVSSFLSSNCISTVVTGNGLA